MADKQHILLVDDDPNISHLVRLYLEKEGFGVTECDRGDTAIDAFRSCNPALVLLDVMLPGKDGLEVLKEIPEIAIVRLSQSDVVRHDLVQTVVKAYEAYERNRGAKA